LPELFAVVVALDAPLNVTVAPLPLAAGLIAPESVNVCAVAVPVKAGTEMFPPFTVTDWDAGENV
jgi:hypothetical protein